MDEAIVSWGVVCIAIALVLVVWHTLRIQDAQFVGKKRGGKTPKTMPCSDCLLPIPFAYGSVETKSRCYTCEKKYCDEYRAREMSKHRCSMCGRFGVAKNRALCWHCSTNTPLSLTVQLPRYKDPHEFMRLMSGYAEQVSVSQAPTRLYSLESDVRLDA